MSQQSMTQKVKTNGFKLNSERPSDMLNTLIENSQEQTEHDARESVGQIVNKVNTADSFSKKSPSDSDIKNEGRKS